MRIEFRTNVGSRDCERYGLKFNECLQGMRASVNDKTGQSLVSRRLADEVPDEGTTEPQEQPAESTPAEILAVPDTPAIGESPEPEIKADHKQARGASRKQTHLKDEQ